MGVVRCELRGKRVKARRDTYGATGHAHINPGIIFVTLYNNNYYFFIIVRGRFRVAVGVDVIKNNLIGRKLISLFISGRNCIPSSHNRERGETDNTDNFGFRQFHFAPIELKTQINACTAICTLHPKHIYERAVAPLIMTDYSAVIAEGLCQGAVKTVTLTESRCAELLLQSKNKHSSLIHEHFSQLMYAVSQSEASVIANQHMLL